MELWNSCARPRVILGIDYAIYGCLRIVGKSSCKNLYLSKLCFSLIFGALVWVLVSLLWVFVSGDINLFPRLLYYNVLHPVFKIINWRKKKDTWRENNDGVLYIYIYIYIYCLFIILNQHECIRRSSRVRGHWWRSGGSWMPFIGTATIIVEANWHLPCVLTFWESNLQTIFVCLTYYQRQCNSRFYHAC